MRVERMLFFKGRKKKKKEKGKDQYPPKAYLVSHPKSGRTWLRALVGRYLCQKHRLPEDSMFETNKITAEAGLLALGCTHDHSGLSSQLHCSELSYNAELFDDKKVIFLERDLKDTLVSYYHQATKRRLRFDGPISEFIRSEVFGIRKILRFYHIWLSNRERPKAFLHISYEEMHKDAQGTLKSVLEFIGEEDIKAEDLEEAVEYCAFSRMKKMEKNNAFDSGIMRAKDNSDPNSFKVRKGVVGGYQDELCPDDVEYIDEIISEFKEKHPHLLLNH